MLCYHTIFFCAHMNHHSLYDAWGIYTRTQIIGSSIIALLYIIDNYSSWIEVSASNDILFLIVIDNINHLSINEYILAVLIKYQFLHLHIIVRIKCIHHYLILNGFWWYLRNISLGYCLSIDHSSSSTAMQYEFINYDVLLYQPT